MEQLILNPDDWLARHPAVCVGLIGVLMVLSDWLAPVSDLLLF